MSNDQLNTFFQTLKDHFNSGSFLKLNLGNYKGDDKTLKKIIIKPIQIKKGHLLSFTYRHQTKDITKNYSLIEGIELLKNYLSFTNFKQASYLSTEKDITIQFVKAQKIIIKTSTPQQIEKGSLAHNKQKNRKITTENKTYLQDLKIVNSQGKIYSHAQDKFKQINHYIEILSKLISQLPNKPVYRAVDMGSGKGYLTFALYDYLTNHLNKTAEIVGVEYRQDMVNLCNNIAQKSDFNNLGFKQGTINDFEIDYMDILIALHACDTATDDAIKKGIDAQAELIIVAPCCHKQIRRELEKQSVSNDLDFLTKHGIFMERHAEMLTDGIRAQILEYFGYKTRVFEFIALDHTPKNVLIVAQKNSKSEEEKLEILKTIKNRKTYFGIEKHYLESIMNI